VHQLAGTDPKLANSYESPNNVVAVKVAAPKVDGKVATITVPPLSFTAIEASL
jgi:alpha-L-arabinofuranosidase